MKLLIKFFILLNLVIQFYPTNIYSLPIDLTKSDLYVKRAFSSEWIHSLPDDPTWKKIPPGINGKRKVRVLDLEFEGVPKRLPLSLKRYSMETYTFVTSFEISKKTQADTKILGLFLAQIGMNWEIYLNGHLLKREMHLSSDGDIISSRNHRDVLEYLHPSFLKEGRNILAYHIIGDPYYIETGFYWSAPYVIDNYKKLLEKNSETIPLILIFIYLFLGIYHLFLFSSRTQEKYNLYFGLFTFFLFIYLLTRTHTVYAIIDDTTLITRIELIILYCIFPAAGFFFAEIILNRITIFYKCYTAFCGILILFTIPFSLSFITDILRIWQYTAIVPLIYIIVIMIKAFVKTVKELMNNEKNKHTPRSTFSIIIQTLSKEVIGNLLIGFLVAIACTVFDIIDAVYLATGIALTKYGFFVFLISITFVLTNRFQFIHSQIENLNVDLQDKIVNLNNANIQLSVSREKYKLLIEGTDDIIFSLDNDWKFITVNRAIQTHLGVKPEKVISQSIFDFLYEDKHRGSVSQQFIQEKLEEFSTTREPVYFKAEFTSPLIGEPKEMHVRLEYINIEGKNEILGKASRKVEDSLLKYFISERQEYSIKNYLFAAEEISHRLTRNLEKYIDPKKITFLRIALREIIINSIEHGNLEITFDEKTDSMMKGTYFEMVGKRQNDPKYSNRLVSIEYAINASEVVYTISDEGQGFDSEKILSSDLKTTNKELLAHGRGIIMAREIFDQLEYSNNGKSVVLKKSLIKDNYHI